MATQTEQVNIALGKLGANSLKTNISNLRDRNAVIMNVFYEPCRRKMLNKGLWTFAIKRDVLSLSTGGESNAWSKYGLNYIYNVPSDFIRMAGWDDENAVVKFEGNKILSDSSGGDSERSINIEGAAYHVIGIEYVYGDFIRTETEVYFCILAHVGSATNRPTDGTYMDDYWIVSEELVGGVWKTIATNMLGILYVFDQTDAETFLPYFVEAFTDQLALDASYKIKQSNVKTAQLKIDAKESLRQAKSIEAMSETPQSPKQSYWLDAKYVGVMSGGAQKINFR